MLKLENISKKFNQKQVLKNINLKIEKNTIVGLLGPNGAGKTTLMRVMVGFFKANSGSIYWEKNKIENLDENYKKYIGYLPENNPLYTNLTVSEYLELIANLKGVDNDDLRTKIIKICEECGVKNVISQKLETLSKGYRQRVGLAAALLGDPKLLILDEPTSGLDPKQIIEIRQLIKKLAKKKTVLLSTHILPEAKEVCDRVLIINNGEIVLDKETSKIKNLEKQFIQLTS